MFQRIVHVLFLMISMIFCCGSAFAGKVELTTYYPAPFGEYRQLQANGNDADNNSVALRASGTDTANPGLAVTNANNVGIGTVTPAAKLDVAGNVRIGTTGPQASQDGRNLRADVTDNIVTDDVYLRNPRTGAPRWASEAAGGTAAAFGPVCAGPLLSCAAGVPTTLNISGRSFCALSSVTHFNITPPPIGASTSAACNVTAGAGPGDWTLAASWSGNNSGVICRAICS